MTSAIPGLGSEPGPPAMASHNSRVWGKGDEPRVQLSALAGMEPFVRPQKGCSNLRQLRAETDGG